LTYRSFLCGENLVAVASIVQKWARFDLKWAWSEFFFARAIISLAPPTFNIFLRLWTRVFLHAGFLLTSTVM